MVTWWLPPLQPLIPHSETFKTMHGWEKRILSGGFIFLSFFYQTENLLTEAWAFSSPATNTCMHTHTHTLPCKPLPESDGQTQKSNLRKSMYGVWAFVVRHELHRKKKRRVKERKLLLGRKPIGGSLRNGITKYRCCFEQCTMPLPPLTAHPLPNALREYTSSHTSMHPRSLVPGACNISHLCTSVAYLFIFFLWPFYSVYEVLFLAFYKFQLMQFSHQLY